jgi:predicted MFS family arabinose efflux permease
LFLSDDYGYSDVEAGFIFGALGGTWTIYAMLLGTVVDRWGIRRSVVIAAGSAIVAVTLFTFSRHEVPTILTIVFILPLPGAIVVPAAKIAPRRYTPDEIRGVAYSLLFFVM